MAQHRRKRSHKSGLPPGTVVHIGEAMPGKVTLSTTIYGEKKHLEKAVKSVEECPRLPDPENTIWIDIQGLSDTEMLHKFEERYGVHALVLEDIANTVQRPKIEDYGTYLFLVLRGLRKHVNRVESEQISLIYKDGFVFSFQEGLSKDHFSGIRERIRFARGKLVHQKTDYLFYSLLDSIVDGYFEMLEVIGERIEEVEKEAETNPSLKTLNEIHSLNRQVLFMRKIIWPMREVTAYLERGESDLITDNTRIFLRDVHDHVIQLIDMIETYREMLSGLSDIYLSTISNRTNEIMRFLTVVGTIFIPLTFLTSLYGMNFQYMPELSWKSGYFILLGFMAVLTGGMIYYFSKKKWL
jgi:magnesium transporter